MSVANGPGSAKEALGLGVGGRARINSGRGGGNLLPECIWTKKKGPRRANQAEVPLPGGRASSGDQAGERARGRGQRHGGGVSADPRSPDRGAP